MAFQIGATTKQLETQSDSKYYWPLPFWIVINFKVQQPIDITWVS